MAYLLEILSTLLVIAVLIGIMLLISKRLLNKLSKKQYQGWLIAHIIFVILAMAGVLGILLLTLVSATLVTEPGNMQAAHFLTRYFSWFLIIPGILGSFISGMWLALRTKWGLTNYYWIIAKVLGTITAILFGSTWMPVWMERTLSSLQNPSYYHSRQMLLTGVFIALIIMLSLVVISYLKPGGKRRKV